MKCEVCKSNEGSLTNQFGIRMCHGCFDAYMEGMA